MIAKVTADEARKIFVGPSTLPSLNASLLISIHILLIALL
jgi:hypothetical protein